MDRTGWRHLAHESPWIGCDARARTCRRAGSAGSQTRWRAWTALKPQSHPRRSIMNKFLIGALATLSVGAATGGIVAASGIVNVAANEPHSPFVYQALAFARERSIASRSSDIKIPEDFADPERLRRGAGNYAAMCANCHLSPEMADSEIRKGLYPTPPNLSAKAEAPSTSRNAARGFWMIKNGIKASGMPAWSAGGMEDRK